MHLLHPSPITLHPLPFTHHPSSITRQVAAPYAGALYPSWGASSVLLYGLPSSPLAQPYNLIVGHVTASVVGLVTRLCFGDALQVNHTNAHQHQHKGPNVTLSLSGSELPSASRWPSSSCRRCRAHTLLLVELQWQVLEDFCSASYHVSVQHNTL